jgi:LuxR family transcriptional regulator, maltose regulon positive regulatory protein
LYNDSVTEALLQTKLHIPPLRASFVPRPRLIVRLNAGLEGRLTLVSAPAGYGKTTLVTEWLSSLVSDPSPHGKVKEVQAAWLSLDEGDNDPMRFLAYLIAAVQQIQPGFGESVRAMLRSPQLPPAEMFLTALVNELAAIPMQFILVLDDYHVIHSLPIHQQLSFLLEHQPARMHLVLMTREDPLLPIPRLRARGQVLEIRQEDLCFTVQEAADFLERVMGLGLSPENVAALEQRTEGWIAGLQLAALSMQGMGNPDDFVQAFTGSNRFVLDYLIEEVFKQQPAEVQDFLLKSSILERLCERLCDAVISDPASGTREEEKRSSNTDQPARQTGSQAILERLDASNLFIVPLDQSRTWYRYHHLFSELLRVRLRASPMYDEASLHKRASRWFETEGHLAEAIQHELAAMDWIQAGKLIQRVSGDMLKRGETVSLVGWYNRIPEDRLLADPGLYFNYCWSLLLAGQFETPGRLLERAEQAMQAEPALLGQVAAAQAYLERARGEHACMIEHSERALALLPKSEVGSRGLVAVNLGLAYWHMGKMQAAEGTLTEALEAGQATGNTYAVLTAIIFQGRVLAVRAQLKQAAGMFEKAIELGGQIPINCLAHLDMSLLYYEWNDLEASRRHLEQAGVLCERSGNVEFQVSTLLMEIRLNLAQGDITEAQQALDKALELIHSGKVPAPTAARVVSAQVQVALARWDLAAAGQLESQLPENSDTHPFYRYMGMVKAQLWLAQGRKDAARPYLAALYARAEEGGWKYGMIAVRVQQAVAAERQEEGIKFLGEALEMAQPENIIRTFAEAGDALVPHLQEAARMGIKPEHVGRILSVRGEMPKTIATGPSTLVEPLSGRELEVLRLVTAGLSNREIAGKLVISPGTAKTHIHNLCGKLGVRNRTEAAMKAKELGLV